MRRLSILIAATITSVVALLLTGGTAQAATPHFGKVSAHVAGEELEIDFVERGLVPGQNYAYVASADKVVETFQCYRSSTFTPLPKTFKVSSLITSPDVRGYTADANGVVKGFVFVSGMFNIPDKCTGADRETVAIHITYTNFQLSDIFTHSFADVTGTFAAPVEPD